MADDTNSSADRPAATDVRTFLIADVRGYTRFTQDRGDHAASELAIRFARIVRDTVPEFSGELLEVRGDEALCTFGSARQAIRASIELQRQLRTAHESQPAFPLGVGIGLDAGEAVPTDGGYRGAALNVAARLCSAAAPGQILATETVTQLARRVDGARYLPPRVLRLKGIDTAVRAVEVNAEQPLPPVPPTPAPPRQRRWVIPACVSAVVLVLVIVAAVHRAGGPSAIPIRAGSVVAIDAGSGTIRDDIAVPVGSAPAPLLVGEGALWTYNATRQTLVRIDPRTRHAAERGIGVAPTDLAVGAGYEWIADGVNNKLYQLQWESGLPPTPVRLPRSTFQLNTASNFRPSESGQVTVHGDVVWATSQGTGWPHTVVAISASDLSQLQKFHVSEITRQIGDLESGPAGVWMENRIEGANSGKAALAALTPTALGPPQYVSQGNYLQQGVAVSRSEVWFAGGTSRVVAELDPSPPYPWVPVDTPYPVTAIAAGPAGVWAATSDPGLVYQFNPHNQRIIRTVKVGQYVTGIAVGKHRVWVLVQSTRVTA